MLDSIDLNPTIAALGQDVGQIVGNATSALGSSTSSSSTTTKRSFDPQNVLYSINDYSGNTHTNRVLGQDGNLFDVKLDNDGNEQSSTVVGSYLTAMTFTGHNQTVSVAGEVREYELEYKYHPFPGIEVISLVYVTPAGKVTRTMILAEA